MTDKRSYFLDSKYDKAYKFVFASEKVLLGFLNSLMKECGFPEISKVHPIGTEYLATNIEDKICRIDVGCKDSEGNLYVVEMQRRYHLGFEQRMANYMSKTFSGQVYENYKDYKKVYVIVILDFKYNTTNDYIQVYPEVSDDNKFLDFMTFISIDLHKFSKILKENKSNKCSCDIDHFLYFYKYANQHKKEEIHVLAGEYQPIYEAYRRLIHFDENVVNYPQYLIDEKEEKNRDELEKFRILKDQVKKYVQNSSNKEAFFTKEELDISKLAEELMNNITNLKEFCSIN